METPATRRATAARAIECLAVLLMLAGSAPTSSLPRAAGTMLLLAIVAVLLPIGIVVAVILSALQPPLDIAELYARATEAPGGGVAWPGGVTPPSALRGAALENEVAANWTSVVDAMPSMAGCLHDHGVPVAYALSEAAIGPMFGHDDPQSRFVGAYMQLAWARWHPELHDTLVAAGTDAAAAADGHAQALWQIHGGDVPTIQHPALLAIARSRWAAMRKRGAGAQLHA